MLLGGHVKNLLMDVCDHSSEAHMSCISFSAASKASFGGILLLLAECLGFLLAK